MLALEVVIDLMALLSALYGLGWGMQGQEGSATTKNASHCKLSV